jgi:hypothetical protein
MDQDSFLFWCLNENLDTGQFVAFGQAIVRFSVKTQPTDLVRAGQVPSYL